MTGEFEDRDNGLNELPVDILQERDELQQFQKEANPVPPGGDMLNPQPFTPPDIFEENKTRSKEGKPASPVIPANVTSTFDTRPINARDFLHTGTDTWSDDGDETRDLIAELSYTVPQGYVGILRGFCFAPGGEVAFTEAERIAGVEFESVKATLLVDSIIIPDYENMSLGQSVDFSLPTHVIANEGQQFKLRVTASVAWYNGLFGGLPLVGDSVTILMTLYGNNLLSRGLPIQFEVATQNISGR